MSLIVKTCGLRTREDVSFACQAGANLLGFVVETPSPRRLSVEEGARLASFARMQTANENIKTPKITIVCVNPELCLLQDIVQYIKPDYIQFHGDETPQELTKLKRYFEEVDFIKALSIHDKKDCEKISLYREMVSFVLCDAPPPNGHKDDKEARHGGYGRVFNWRLLQSYQGGVPLLIAGGLSPENITQALQVLSGLSCAQWIVGVDVSSGVELDKNSCDAMKDINTKSATDTFEHTALKCPQKLHEFCKKAHAFTEAFKSNP